MVDTSQILSSRYFVGVFPVNFLKALVKFWLLL